MKTRTKTNKKYRGAAIPAVLYGRAVVLAEKAGYDLTRRGPAGEFPAFFEHLLDTSFGRDLSAPTTNEVWLKFFAAIQPLLSELTRALGATDMPCGITIDASATLERLMVASDWIKRNPSP